MTDAALLNLFALSNQTRLHAMNSWFGAGGAFYTLLRLPIGGCDFSTLPYSLDDRDDDFDLEHFNLSQIDLEMRLPFLRIVRELSDQPVNLIGSAWSPPVWLKTTSKFNGIGRLRGEPGDKFHKTWAKYYVKVSQNHSRLRKSVKLASTRSTFKPWSTPVFPFGRLRAKTSRQWAFLSTQN